MAASSSIPEPLRRGLRDLAALPEPVFEELLTALEKMPIEIRQHRVFPDIEVPNLPESIPSAVFALIIGRARPRAPISDAVQSVIEALSLSNFDPAQLDILRKRAEAILSIASADLIARAHSVLLEHSCTYSSARIISDIRAIFGDDVTSPPDGAVIVHMLNISYYNAGRRENIAVALDEKDVDLLIAVLERARAKNKILKSTIEKGGIRYIGVG